MKGNSRIWIFLVAASLALVGCGGTSNQSPSGSAVTVTPSGAQILAGATQQMQATAGDGGKSFTWQVNGTAGGSPTTGTISSSGLYTAPALPPAGGKVTVTAVEQGGAGSSGTAALTIQFSNASLNGNYVFHFGGRNLTTPLYAIGEFTANGAGQLQNGLEDSNDGTSAQTSIPTTGLYTINPDGSGTLTIGGIAFRVALQANGGAALLSTTNGTTLSGQVTVQAASASTTNFTGPLVISANGQVNNQAFAQLALASTVQGGTLSGYEDVSGASPAVRSAWTGSYSFGGSNHGELALTDATGTHAYSFYAISSVEYVLLSNDPASPAAGRIQTQTSGTYSSASLNGAYVFLIRGNSSTQAFAQAGQINPNGSGQLGQVTEDINLPGNLQTALTTVGTYTFDAGVNGRGTLTLNNQGAGAPQNYVFYLLSPNQAEFITSGSNFTGSGEIVLQQNAPSDVSALNGTYDFLLSAWNGPTDPAFAIATMTLDGTGKISGGNMFQTSGGTISATISLSGSYALSSTTRGTATLISNGGASTGFALYPISPSQFFLISTSASSAFAGRASFMN